MPDGGHWEQFGLIGVFCGSMLGAQLWFMRHLVTVALPKMMTDFAAEIREERDTRIQHHAENRADHHRLYERIEKVESVIATSIQATRHRLVNLEMGLNGIAEVLKQVREEQVRRNPRRERPPEKESGG
jgi:adenosyl cobinamide kinase/adenosyl cobinamide phosphate guanylyltransferase